MLSRLSLSSAGLRGDTLVLRFVSMSPAGRSAVAARPKPAKIQLQKPPNVEGYLKYERNFSRDSSYSDPPVKGDLPIRYLTRRLGHAIELGPVFFLVALWHVVFFFTVYWSFDKFEIWVDRSKRDPPWDWSRCRDTYWKKPALLIDPYGAMHQRLPPEYEQLQDELIEAAKKRGTR